MKAISPVILASILVSAFATGGRADNVPSGASTPEARIGGEGASAFEALYEFTNLSKYKKAGAPVGYLSVQFANQRYGTVIRGMCTATLIEPSLIVTANHCLIDDEDATNSVASAVLWMGYDDDFSRASPFPVRPKPVEQDKTLDYAILHVEGDPTTTFGVVSLSEKNPEFGEELFVIHHPGAIRKQLTRRLCRTRQIANPHLRHNCHTAKGSSGAPLFSDNDAAPRLVAIHGSSKVFMNQTLNEGTLVSEIAKKSCVVKNLLLGLTIDKCGSTATAAQTNTAAPGEHP